MTDKIDTAAMRRLAAAALDEVIPPHLRSSRHGEGFMGQRYETIRSALSLLDEIDALRSRAHAVSGWCTHCGCGNDAASYAHAPLCQRPNRQGDEG